MNILKKYKCFDFRLLWDDLKNCTYTYHVYNRMSNEGRDFIKILVVDYRNYKTLCTVSFERFLDGKFHLLELNCPDSFQCKKFFYNKDIILLDKHIELLEDKTPFKDLKLY